MLFRKTLAPDALELLNELMQKPWLKQFNLVGGTSLALQIGHRMSIDLDMFCSEPFDTIKLKSLLENEFPSFLPDLEFTNTLIVSINGIKVDFIRFKYGFAYPVRIEDNIRLCNIKDIAPMKIDAIVGRGRKKDFYDLYFLLKKFTLSELLDLYQAKYKHSTILHVIKSINYFEDAEADNSPKVFDKKLTWEKVKKAIVKEIRKI